MRGEIDWTLLAKYLGGDATPEEKEFIETSAVENKEFAETLNDLTEIWNLSSNLKGKIYPAWTQEKIDQGIHKLNQALREAMSEESEIAQKLEEDSMIGDELKAYKNIWDASKNLSEKNRYEFSDEKLASVMSRMKQKMVDDQHEVQVDESLVSAEVKEVEMSVPSFNKQKFVNYYRSVAAASIVFLVAFLGGYYLLFKQGADFQTVVAYEETQYLKLQDGSEIWLEKGSKIQFPVDMRKGERNLTLQGAAFFEVARDEERPFSIITEGAKVEVLGTSFKFSENEGEAIVEVVTGKVSFSSIEDPENKLLLVKSQKGVLKEGQLSMYEAISSDATLYMKEYLEFDSERLEDVVKVVGKAYQVDIRVEPDLKDIKFTGTFKNKPLSTLLSQMTLAVGAKSYMDEESNVILIEKE